MSFVCVDIGASNTRFVAEDGKIGFLPNNTVFLNESDIVDIEPYDSSIENALEVCIKKDGESKNFPMRVLIGSMASRYSTNNERPNSLELKHKQKINYASILTAMAICKLKTGSDKMDLYLALPPNEVNSVTKQNLNEELIGEYTVSFDKFGDGIKAKFSITSVNCHEESFLAMLSYFFEMNGVVRPVAQDFLTGTVLSIDIGASTTDIAIIKDGRYLEMSGKTYPVGGNMALDFLTDIIRAKHGFGLSVQEVSKVMEEGRMRIGNTWKEIPELVNRAKEELATRVSNNIKNYFSTKDESINMFRAIITSGGGSMRSQYVDANGEPVITSKPISDYITEMIKDICPEIEALPHGDSPRTANISGLFIRASANEIKRKAKEARNQKKDSEASAE